MANSQALTHQNLLKINYFSTAGSLNFIVMVLILGGILYGGVAAGYSLMCFSAKRAFCNYILRYLQKEPEEPKFI